MRYLMILLARKFYRHACRYKSRRKLELQRYLGQWYEIARLDHSFERGLTHVSGHYTINNDGSVTVTNRGFKTDKNRWDEAGASFDGKDPTVGHLKFLFRAFFSSYVIFELDQLHYQYAFVTSYNKEFLWLLARTPTVDEDVIQRFKAMISIYDFDQQSLIWVDHS